MNKILSAFAIMSTVVAATPAWSQTPENADTVREYQVVSTRAMAAGQGANAAQISTQLVQDVSQTTAADGSAQLTVTPTQATVGVSGAGTSEVPLDDAPSTTVSSNDVAAAAPPSAVTVVDNDAQDATSLRVESDLPAPAGSGVNGGPVTVNTNSTTATRNGEPVAAVTTYASEPISFTTANGDTVVMRTEGFSATDPATGQPIASGSRSIGQTVTAAGDLVPFAMQSSSAAGPGSGSGAGNPGGNAAAGLGAVAGLLADYSGPLASRPASSDGPAPPAWLGAVAGVAGGVDALASSASAPGGSDGGSGNNGSGGGVWAALGQANGAAADALVGPAAAAAGGSYAGLGGGAGDGSGGASDEALAAAAQGAFGGADAGNGEGGSGVTVSSGVGASGTQPAGGSGFGGGDPIAMALGSGGSADTAAFGGGAIYGNSPGGGAGLPDLSSQVVVSDQSVARNAVANLAVAPGSGPSLFALPPSTGGLSSINVPNALLTFSVFDNGGIDNEDVVNITATDVNGLATVSPSGSNVTLLFLTNGQGTTFNASTNPAVGSNQFSVSLSPGTAQLNFEAVSSVFGGNTGQVEITSPVLSGPSTQIFDLPQAGGDFARLNIQVAP